MLALSRSPLPRYACSPRRITHGRVTRRASSAAPTAAKVHATAPKHQCYIFLHAAEPPTAFPARKTTAIQRVLQARASRWGGVVNFSWSADTQAAPDEARVQGTAYSAAGRLGLTNVALENIDEVAARIAEHAAAAPGARAVQGEQGLDFYVCTHGQRDCRCLEHGKPVVDAFQAEIARRRLKDTLPPINVYECGHVGQHALAANVLLYPHGEWFGLLRPEHVPDLLQQALSVPARPRTADDAPLFRDHWRGRMGLSQDEQKLLLSSHIA